MVNYKLGIITYAHPHMKTEQVIFRLVYMGKISPKNIKVYMLPYIKKKDREVYFMHRPAQDNAVHPELLCKKYGINYVYCKDDTDIDSVCDIYMVTGAGILSGSCVHNKKIINCHPGIIPVARGLDAFKWSIYNMYPMGVTLHYIDENVDEGEIICILETPLYNTDTLEIFARRHYENEICMLSLFQYFLDNPKNDYHNLKKQEAVKRMPLEIEKLMVNRFEEYKHKYAFVLD